MALAEVFTRGDFGSVAQLVGTIGGPLLLVALAFHTPSSSYVRRWASNRSLRLTDGNRSLVRAYVQRTRRLRTIGGAAGFLAGALPGTVYNFVDPASPLGRTLVDLATSWWASFALIVGYLAGALVAELTLARPRDAQRSGAALSPREVRQYVTPWARNLLWGLAALLVAMVPLPAVLTFERNSAKMPSVGRYAAIAALGIVVVALVEWLQRMIVRRPQSFVDTDLVEADDAVRSSSVHACLGVGLTLLMSMASGVLLEISSDAVVGPVRWIVLGPAVFCLFGSIFAWLSFGTSYAWTVRRSPATRSPETPASA